MGCADLLISRLPNVLQTSPTTWRCGCPVHNKDGSRSRPISVRDVGDKILIKCFAGCDRRDIVAAIGLQESDLFERTSDDYGQHQRREHFPARDVLACMAADAITIYVMAAAIDNGRPLGVGDRLGLHAAVCRFREGARLAGAL